MLRKLAVLTALLLALPTVAFAAEMGCCKYADFKKPKKCGMCHRQIYKEWKDTLMSKSYTHEWDQVEYFKLALPHSQKLEKVAGVKAGCIACHSPLAFLSGDIPPKPAHQDTRANEGVSCEVCHNITGTSEKVPFNFSFNIEPGNLKRGPRKDAVSPMHKTAYSEFHKSAEMCATCHDEQSPYGAWVKATYREWKEGPYAKEGRVCQDCHMPKSPGKSAGGGKERKDVAHHTFLGSHSATQLAGAVDLKIEGAPGEAKAGEAVKFQAKLFNGKAGHPIPSGSTEERMLWLEVWAVDANGKKYPVPVSKKGFKGEEYTIADSSAMAYQAIGEIMEIKDFKGLKRDGNVPDGARIFRHPFFDPKGRMTICQWYTKDNTLVDYRIKPKETVTEDYSWTIPADLKGKLTIKANLYYSQIPSSVGEFFKLPESEYAPILVNSTEINLNVR